MALDPVDAVAYRVWDEYYKQLAVRTGLARKRGSLWENKHYRTFRAIAQLCMEYKFDPVEFIAISFDLTQRSHMVVTPRDFLLPDAIVRYMDHRQRPSSHPAHDWASQEAKYTSLALSLVPLRYPNGEALLRDFQQAFSAWFRVLYPERWSEALFEAYGAAAWSELQQDTRLRKFARNRAPDNFKELEKRIASFGDVEDLPVIEEVQ